jgi:hypothetical protein
MLTVTTPASSYDLTLLATVKGELGITNRASDVLLKRCIKQASDVAAKFCNRVFACETLTETFRDHRDPELVLARYPVVEIVSVLENETSVEATGYEVDTAAGIITRLSGDRLTCWASGKLTIVYRAGFPTLSDLPDGIERAVIQLCKSYASSGDRDPLIRSETIEGAGVTEYFSGAGTGLPPEVEGLLSPHVKQAIG